MGKKFKKTMTEKQLRANKMNAQKSTGPKTEEGKAISSMNAVTTGEYIQDFFKLDGRHAGKMKFCSECGDEQKAACIKDESCLLHKNLTYAYVQTVKTGNTKFLEVVNSRQLATMDMMFTRQLRYAQKHLGEEKEITTKDGLKRTVPIISMEYIKDLMTMMEKLSKTLPDMQLTKRTQENIDVAWAELAKAEVDPEKAAEVKTQILNKMDKWRSSKGKAAEMEQEDPAIQEFEKNEKRAKATDENSEDMDLGGIGVSPFGQR